MAKLIVEINDKIVSAMVIVWASRGPWALAHDGASSGADQLLVTMANNAFDEEVFVECVNCSYGKKTSAVIAADLKRSLMLVPVVASINTDRASNCQGAKHLLQGDPEVVAKHPNLAYLDCQEHAGHTFTGDVVNAMPWLKANIKDVHKASKYIHQKKRLRNLVAAAQATAKKNKVLQQKLKIRGVRATRFCSAHRCYRAFHANKMLVAGMWNSDSFQGCIAKKDEKYNRAFLTWTKEPFTARALRGEKILEPIACFIRCGGQSDFSASWLSAHRLKENFQDKGINTNTNSKTKISNTMGMYRRNKRQTNKPTTKQQQQPKLCDLFGCLFGCCYSLSFGGLWAFLHGSIFSYVLATFWLRFGCVLKLGLAS